MPCVPYSSDTLCVLGTVPVTVSVGVALLLCVAEAAIACLNFRILIPNVTRTENGPYRTNEWVRWVMRAILMSKMVRLLFVRAVVPLVIPS